MHNHDQRQLRHCLPTRSTPCHTPYLAVRISGSGIESPVGSQLIREYKASTTAYLLSRISSRRAGRGDKRLRPTDSLTLNMDPAPRSASLHSVAEAAREQEVFKYCPSLLSESTYYPEVQSLPKSNLSTSGDTILTALAQLATLQTKSQRAFISLFDAQYQHCIAEATPESPIIPNAPAEDCPDGLWSCGIAIPRRDGSVCETCLEYPLGSPGEVDVFVVPDLAQDDRFLVEPRYGLAPNARFYAAAPILSRKAVKVGLCVVVDDGPRYDWDTPKSQALANISRCIMSHLEHLRPATVARRSVRMNRGIGSFIEGKSTLSGWRNGPDSGAFADMREGEGQLNAMQQDMDTVHDEQERKGDGITCEPRSTERYAPQHGQRGPATDTKTDSRDPSKTPMGQVPCLPTASSEPEEFESPSYDDAFSRAANMIRESLEVEGCYFFDAQSKPGGFSSLSPRVDVADKRCSPHSSQSSEDECSQSSNADTSFLPCPTLGFSVSASSSIDGPQKYHTTINMPAAFLSKLLQRYPDGKIFNFNSLGDLLPSDLSEEDRLSQDEKSQPRSQNKTAKQVSKPWARHREGRVLLEAIPNAVSAIFVPIWDSRKDRWYAGSFVYTCTPRRFFTAGGELSYIRAFGMLTMAEVIRRDTAIADKAKMDALGSLSHELRSPLHGVVLGVELLQDTDLGVFQGNILHTIETCGRTLVDTLDHLLDFSKVNHLATSQKDKTQQSGRTLVRQMSFGPGSKSLSSEVRIDSLAEEVVESVFAGFNFKHASAAQLSQHRQTTFAEPPGAQRHRDAQHNALDFGSDLTSKGDMSLDFSKVAVVLSIDAAEKWQFYTQPGALRRIIMNLFGNALKYTEKGMIHVSIRQEESPRKSQHGGRVVILTIADTGKGISEDYLRNDLFKPFSQEDHLCSGTGLGLSLVKKITTSLGGSIHVESQVGLGTIASVSLPLTPAMYIPSQAFKISEEEEIFKAQVSELKGLRVALVGFHIPSTLGGSHKRIISERQANYHELMMYTCRAWLHMEVLTEEEADKVNPDFTLAIGNVFERLNGSSSAQPPCIVVCDDALQAYHQTVSHSNAYSERVFEFISQPVGPRKLAKVLVLAFNRWLDVQECPKPPSLMRSRSSVNTNSTSHMHTPVTETLMSTQRSTKPLSRTSLQSTSTKSLRSHQPVEPYIEILPRSRYLLVDDNAINLKILVSYMKKLRREFDMAKNGQEAVEQYTSRPKAFACILMDISMPVMDGFEATKQIRELERKQHLDAVTIIALTGLASEDAQQEAYGSGVDLFLTKPVKLKDLEAIFKDRNLALD